jgi:hypothetical protein
MDEYTKKQESLKDDPFSDQNVAAHSLKKRGNASGDIGKASLKKKGKSANLSGIAGRQSLLSKAADSNASGEEGAQSLTRKSSTANLSGAEGRASLKQKKMTPGVADTSAGSTPPAPAATSAEPAATPAPAPSAPQKSEDTISDKFRSRNAQTSADFTSRNKETRDSFRANSDRVSSEFTSRNQSARDKFTSGERTAVGGSGSKRNAGRPVASSASGTPSSPVPHGGSTGGQRGLRRATRRIDAVEKSASEAQAAADGAHRKIRAGSGVIMQRVGSRTIISARKQVPQGMLPRELPVMHLGGPSYRMVMCGPAYTIEE